MFNYMTKPSKDVLYVIAFLCSLFFLNLLYSTLSLSRESIKDLVDGDAHSLIDENTAKPVEKKDLPNPDEVNLKLSFMGDVFWGRYVNDWSQASSLKYQYPFSGLNTFQKVEKEAWIANLECPITPINLSSTEQDRLLKFTCLPQYLPEASKWFDVFSLANNHTDNMEDVMGYEVTKDYLEKSDIQYFGHYNNKQDNICNVVTLEGSASFSELKTEVEYQKVLEMKSEDILEEYNNDSLTTIFNVPIALCGYHNVFRLPTKEELSEISKYSKLFPTFVMPHQGAEYGMKADSLQQKYYKLMIDNGADAVIGGHTHTVHNTEVYNGKLIAYSVGNFIFDQQLSTDVTRSLVVKADMIFDIDDNFAKWLNFAASCKYDSSDCLAEAISKNLQKPTFTIKYDAIVGDSSAKLTKKASIVESNKVLDRINWSKTLEDLGQ